MMSKGEHTEVNVDQINNYFENPRHDIANSQIDTLKKLFEATGTQYMLNLAEDILKNGFLGCAQPTLVYDKKISKYIVYEGNRRIACLKLLLYPYTFSFLGKASINKIKKITSGVNLEDMKNVFCYITNEEEAFFIMERVHSGEDKGRGTKRWSSREKENFKVRRNHSKNMSYLIDFYTKKYFDGYDITSIIPFTTIQRIFNNKEVKKVLDLNVEDENTFTKEKMQIIIDTSKWIIEESNSQSIPATRLFNRAKEIEDGIVPKLKVIVEMAKQKKHIVDLSEKVDKRSISEFSKKQKNGGNSEQKISSAISESKGSGGKNNLPYFFQGIFFGHLDPDDVENHGVVRVCRELQIISTKKLVDLMPMASVFLIRTVIEQSLIYYAKKHKIQGQNKLIWCDIEKISKLSKIIEKYRKNLPNYIIDANMRDYFNKLFTDYNETVNPLNWVIHRPYEYLPNTSEIVDLPQKGLLTIINFLIS